MTVLNEVQIQRLSRRFDAVKAEHNQLLSKLTQYDWRQFGASVKVEGDVIVINCMGHQWEATPRFVLHGDNAIIEYAFHEKFRDEYVLAACLFMDKEGGLYKEVECESADWVFNAGANIESGPLITEILAQATESDVFKPTLRPAIQES